MKIFLNTRNLVLLENIIRPKFSPFDENRTLSRLPSFKKDGFISRKFAICIVAPVKWCSMRKPFSVEMTCIVLYGVTPAASGDGNGMGVSFNNLTPFL